MEGLDGAGAVLTARDLPSGPFDFMHRSGCVFGAFFLDFLPSGGRQVKVGRGNGKEARLQAGNE